MFVRLGIELAIKEQSMDDVTGTACMVLGLALVFSGLGFLLSAPKPRVPKYEVRKQFRDSEVVDSEVVN